MNCIHFKKRSFKYKPYYICTATKQINPVCRGCKDKQYKEVKPMKKRTSKQNKAERERYSLFTDDLTKCIECGKSPVNVHEIFYGNGKRQLSMKYGLNIPLCTCEHHVANIEGIHKDTELCDKWHKLGQKMFMKYYKKNKEEFTSIFGKNYL